VTIVNEAGETSKESLIINRDDFWASTSNKQLNFLQHIFTILKQHGRRGVLPDNVLFEAVLAKPSARTAQAGGLHTLLRLLTGIFYAQGVKQRPVLRPQASTGKAVDAEALDLRSAHEHALHAEGKHPQRSDLDDFVDCYSGTPLRRAAYRECRPVPHRAPQVNRHSPSPLSIRVSPARNPHPLRPPSPAPAGEDAVESERVTKSVRRLRQPAYRARTTGRDRAVQVVHLPRTGETDKVNLDIFWLKDEALEESAICRRRNHRPGNCR